MVTANDLNALKLIEERGGLETTMGDFGFLLYPNGRRSRTAQGMALAGGNMLHRLVKQGLVVKSGSYGSSIYSIKLTKAGELALSQAE